MKQLLFAVSALLCVFGATASAQSQGGVVKGAFEKYDLLGTLSTDCKAGAAKNGYLVNRAIDADHVQLDRMTNSQAREFAAIVDKAEVKGSDIALGYTINDLEYAAVVRVERGRMRWIELARANGQKLVIGGRNTTSGTESQWYSKCAMSITIQSAPEGGGKCIDVTNGQFKAGARLQMWDCNETASQAFSFDVLNGRLAIGDFCIESSGKAGDQLQLAQCKDGPNQEWKAAANGNFVKLVGISDLCADIANYSKDNKAAVGVWKCHGGSNQSWILRQGVDLTIDDNTNREGETLRELNLPSAEAKLCQQECIAEKKCSGWVYRKPEGRNDRQPHCWLRYNVSAAKPSDGLTISGRVRPEAPKK